MCASSFEASAPFTRASHAEYGHFDASLALKQINGLTLHICWMDHVDTMCMYYFKKILGSGASICRQSGFVETGWWVVGHPTNSPLEMVCANATTVLNREASTLLATLLPLPVCGRWARGL